MRLKVASSEKLKLASKTTGKGSNILLDVGNGKNNFSSSGSRANGSTSTSSNISSTSNSSRNYDNKSGKYSMNRKNNNNEDFQSENVDAEICWKRDLLIQRKQKLELILNEKNWMLEQIQKQEAYLLNGNYEYFNLKNPLQQNSHHPKNNTNENESTKSAAVLLSKSTTEALRTGGSSQKTQNVINNNNKKSTTNSIRNLKVSNRSSEYVNYHFANDVNSGSNYGTLTSNSSNSIINIKMFQLPQQEQQMPVKQTLSAASKITTTGAAATRHGGCLQQMQQQLLVNEQLYLQQYITEQKYLQHKIISYNPRQKQKLIQQLQQQQHSNISLPFHDVISLYSVNSANVAALGPQNFSPQKQRQQPTLPQCDKYYISPTHQTHCSDSGYGFIKSSHSIKQYMSPVASPTAAATPYSSLGSTNPGSSILMLGMNNESHQYGRSPSYLTRLPGAHPQSNEISQAPSYAVSMDTAFGVANFNGNVRQQYQNTKCSSHTNIPETISALISPNTSLSHQHHYQYHSHLGLDGLTQSHSSNMLAHVSPRAVSTSTSINMLSTTALKSENYGRSTIESDKQKDNPLDEISISSLNSGEGQQMFVGVKPKQWLESSLDSPIIHRTPATEFVDWVTTSLHRLSHHHGHKVTNDAQISNHQHAYPKPNLSSQPMSVARSGSCSSSTDGSSGGSVNQQIGASRPYSMTKEVSVEQRKELLDDTGRYAKFSQSTSYLHSLESKQISNYIDKVSLLHQKQKTPLAYQYLPPKPVKCGAAQLTPVPPLRPTATAQDIYIPSPAKPRDVSATVIATYAQQSSSYNNNINNLTMHGPDIRKNLTVFQQATFQPYKEVTKPFEMADFYKYSTKFGLKGNTPTEPIESGTE